MPHQQQLCADHCPDRLRELTMPFDHLATNEQPGAFHIWGGFCGSELFHVSYDDGLGRGVIRSQCHRVYFDRNTHVPNADALRFLPYQQQLHP